MTMLPIDSPANVTGRPEAVAARFVVQHLPTDSDGLVGIDGAKISDPDGMDSSPPSGVAPGKPVRADRGVQPGTTRRQYSMNGSNVAACTGDAPGTVMRRR